MFQAIFDYPDYRLTFSTTSTRYTKLHEGAVLDKKQGLTHCQIVVPRRHLHNFGLGRQCAARSRQPWTGEHHRQAKTPEKAQ